MKKVLILGTKNYDYDLSNEFKIKGMESFFCGYQKSCYIPLEKWINIDFTDIKKIIKFLDSNTDFEYIIPGSNDLAYIAVSEVLKAYKNRFKIQIDHPKVAKNYLLKSKFKSQKILDTVLIPQEFDKKNIVKKNTKIVLKQDKMSGGKGVNFFENGKSLNKFLDKNKLTEKFIIEEYVDGLGHGISYFVKNGNIIYEFYDDEYYTKDKLAVVATSTPSSLSSIHKQKIKDFCLNYFDNYKLKNGIFHIQCIRSGKDIYITECTRRLAGDFYHQFASLSLNVSYLSFYIASFLKSDEVHLKNNINKIIVRIVNDELIDSEIKKSIWLQQQIEKNFVMKKKLDGFRYGENGQKFLKKDALFLEFNNIKESQFFCKTLIKNI